MHDVAMRLQNVGMSYHGILPFGKKAKTVLQDVSFEIFRGETLGVIGKNGAGKSSLMKLIAGIIRPDSGQVVSNVDRVQLLSLQVGFIHELSGRENVILSSLLLGMRRKDIEQRMDAIIDFSDLQDAIDNPLRTYSTGMRARLGFAISCQADPDLLLIDEALGVGDSQFREKSRKVIYDRMQSDRAFVLVSHSEAMILEHCTRVLWIDDGKLKMIGEAAAVVEAYRAA
jgi:lipopolysaccharide transport system ATP-binding protein